MKIRFPLALTLALALALPLAADDYAGEILAIGVGARAMGMGGAFVAVANDATAAYWNPAGLTYIRNIELSTIHRTEGTRELSAVGYDFFNVAVNTHGLGAYAATFVMHSVGEIPLTIEDPSQPGNYRELGTFEAKDNALLVSAGYRVSDYVALGLTGKYLWSKIWEAKATGFGFDAGLLVKPWKKLAVGCNVQDIGSAIKWEGTPTNPTDKIKTNVKVGTAFHQRLGDHMLGFAFDVDTKYNPILRYGVEYWYADLAAIRAGLIDRGPSFRIEDKDTSLGAGVKLFLFTLDYAFVDYELVDAHFFSVIARF